ncbi:MAG: GDSL-type esterase/lipase family protein [Planctomycetota bacterium]
MISTHELVESFRDAAVEKWESDIQKLEALDRRQPSPSGGILCIGSSSIRRWDMIERDLSPLRPIQRGYGGARFSDLAIFVDRLVRPHDYRALVVFVANDISGSERDIPAQQVDQLFRYVVDRAQFHHPGRPVFLIEITPTSKRYEHWSRIREVNARMREFALTTPDVYFIPTASHYLTADGKPRDELFVKDLLHLNEAGYQLWGRIIRGRISSVLQQRMDESIQSASADSAQPDHPTAAE